MAKPAASRSSRRHAQSPSPGFDFGDVAIGAGTLAGWIGVAGATALTIRRRIVPAH